LQDIVVSKYRYGAINHIDLKNNDTLPTKSLKSIPHQTIISLYRMSMLLTFNQSGAIGNYKNKSNSITINLTF
jgi:hypothetical protein